MTPNQIFSLVNLVALCSWVLLAVLPRRRWVTNIVTGVAIPALLATVYIAIVATKGGESSGGFSSLPAVAMLFSNPWLLLAGWTHYLAFDLFVGSWEARDARDHGIPHLLVLPCLILTFLFGPAGWMLYLGVRFVYRGGGTFSSAARARGHGCLTKTKVRTGLGMDAWLAKFRNVPVLPQRP